MLLLRRRHGEVNSSAAIRIVLCPNGSAVGLNYGLRNGQAHTHAVELGGEEWIENMSQSVSRDAVACVPHGDLNQRDAGMNAHIN